jgi:hypothetical protein
MSAQCSFYQILEAFSLATVGPTASIFVTHVFEGTLYLLNFSQRFTCKYIFAY